MQINALLDHLEQLIPYLEEIGEADPTREIANSKQLIVLLDEAASKIENTEEYHLAIIGLDEFSTLLGVDNE